MAVDVLEVLASLPLELLPRVLNHYTDDCSPVTLLTWLSDQKKLNNYQLVLSRLAKTVLYGKLCINGGKILFGITELDEDYNWINVTDHIFRNFMSNLKNIDYVKITSVDETFQYLDLMKVLGFCEKIEIELVALLELPQYLQDICVNKLVKLNIADWSEISKYGPESIKSINRMRYLEPGVDVNNTSHIASFPASRNGERRIAYLPKTKMKVRQLGEMSASAVASGLQLDFAQLNLEEYPNTNKKIAIFKRRRTKKVDIHELMKKLECAPKLAHLEMKWVNPGDEYSNLFEKFRINAVLNKAQMTFFLDANFNRVLSYSFPTGCYFKLKVNIDCDKPFQTPFDSSITHLTCQHLSKKWLCYFDNLGLSLRHFELDHSEVLLNPVLSKLKGLEVLKLRYCYLNDVQLNLKSLKELRIEFCVAKNYGFFTSVNQSKLVSLKIINSDINIKELPLSLKYLRLTNYKRARFKPDHRFLPYIHKLKFLEAIDVSELQYWWTGLDFNMVPKLQLVNIHDYSKSYLGFRAIIQENAKNCAHEVVLCYLE